MTTHTPGPWRVVPGTFAGRFIADPNDWPVCNMTGNATAIGMKRERSGEAIANARLIAAAPDLLAALQALLDSATNEDSQWYIAAHRNARAAIEKATRVPA